MIRSPLVLLDGKISELPRGDVIRGSNCQSVTVDNELCIPLENERTVCLNNFLFIRIKIIPKFIQVIRELVIYLDEDFYVANNNSLEVVNGVR